MDLLVRVEYKSFILEDMVTKQQVVDRDYLEGVRRTVNANQAREGGYLESIKPTRIPKAKIGRGGRVAAVAGLGVAGGVAAGYAINKYNKRKKHTDRAGHK